jgi:nucleoid DNA-binding protein
MAKAGAKPKPPSKNEVMSSIADASGLTKKQVAAVFDALAAQIRKCIGKRGTGVFVVPGLMKISRKDVPARPAQKGVKDPFSGNIVDRPAKPASVKVVVRGLKNLKDMVKS